MRRVFLWAARNPWLKEHLPELPFMRRAVRRFMPGETLASALDAAAPLQAAGIATLYTRLGENLDEPRRGRRASPTTTSTSSTGSRPAGWTARSRSSRPSSGSTTTRTATLAHLERLAAHAAATGSYLWVDMEGSAYVEATIRLYERLRATQPRTGICLQAYLKRTADDIERLRPLDPAIRLVKGAYDEPAAIAYRDKRRVDANYLGLAVRFLLDGRGRPIRLGLGTHDVELIEQIAAQVAAAGIGRDAFEIEMLYGIRTGEQHRLAKAGYRVGDAHRLRRALVSVVHAAARRATGQRDVRHPLAVAVGEEVTDMTVGRRDGSRPGWAHRDRERVRGQRPGAGARGGGSLDHPPPDRRARLRHAGARPRGGQAGARRGRDALRAVPGHPGPARGDRRGRRPPQGRRRGPVPGLRHGRRQGRDAVRDPRPGRPGRRGHRARPGLPDLRVADPLRRRDAGADPDPDGATTSGSTSTSWRRSSRRGRGSCSSTRRPTRPAACSPRSDLERIAALAVEHDLWVVADEIYGRILYDGAEHVSIASLPGMAERTIILDGFSKTFAMTGWRLGYAVVPAVAHPDLRAARHQHHLVRPDVRAGRGRRGADRAAGRRRGDGRRVQGPSRPDRRRARTRSPGSAAPRRLGAFYAFPSIARDRPDRRRAGRPAAPRGRRLRPAPGRRSAGSARSTSGSRTPTRART